MQKKCTVFGRYRLCITDGNIKVTVYIGKAAFNLYTPGQELTVGYCGKKSINIRPGICDNTD